LAERSSGIGHRSRLEQTVARWLDDDGLRGWRRNYRVPTGCGTVEVDFGWPEHKVALEVSPFFTHGSRVNQERDAERRQLLVVAGWRVVEATDPDLEHHGAFAGVAASLAALLTPSPRDLVR
jgi:very-short-patch-repair endonuclease